MEGFLAIVQIFAARDSAESKYAETLAFFSEVIIIFSKFFSPNDGYISRESNHRLE
jgi:hypothetical protein